MDRGMQMEAGARFLHSIFFDPGNAFCGAESKDWESFPFKAELLKVMQEAMARSAPEAASAEGSEPSDPRDCMGVFEASTGSSPSHPSGPSQDSQEVREALKPFFEAWDWVTRNRDKRFFPIAESSELVKWKDLCRAAEVYRALSQSPKGAATLGTDCPLCEATRAVKGGECESCGSNAEQFAHIITLERQHRAAAPSPTTAGGGGANREAFRRDMETYLSADFVREYILPAYDRSCEPSAPKTGLGGASRLDAFRTAFADYSAGHLSFDSLMVAANEAQGEHPDYVAAALQRFKMSKSAAHGDVGAAGGAA